MKKQSEVLFLVMSLLYWTQSEGACSGTRVSISGDDRVLPVGEGFNLSCRFTCLRPRHVAQMWRDNTQDHASLANITSTIPDVILFVSVSSATKADTGYYFCMTQPPDTISPKIVIQISDNLTTSAPPATSNPQCDSTQQPNSAAGLQGQIWCWILLGKTTVLLLSLATLAVKYKRG